MDVLEVSQQAMMWLTAASIVHGIVIVVLVAVRDILLNLPSVLRGKIGYADLPEMTVKNTGIVYSLRRALGDIVLCLVSAVLLLIVNFIFNNGKFRIYTGVVSAISYVIANKLLSPGIRWVLVLITRFIKFIVVTFAKPVFWIISIITGVFKAAYRMIRRRMLRAKIIRYTKVKTAINADICQNGMLTKIIKE